MTAYWVDESSEIKDKLRAELLLYTLAPLDFFKEDIRLSGTLAAGDLGCHTGLLTLCTTLLHLNAERIHLEDQPFRHACQLFLGKANFNVKFLDIPICYQKVRVLNKLNAFEVLRSLRDENSTAEAE